MKKGIKIGFAALAMLGMFGGLFLSNNKVEAAKTVKVTLTNATTGSSCPDIADFVFDGTVQSTNQTLGPKTQDLTCSFNKTGAESVKVLSNSLTGPQTISNTGIKLTTTSTCKSQAGVAASTCQAISAQALSTARTVMSKAANTIGTATHTLSITVDVPAYTPQGTYSGLLSITVE